MKISGNTFNYMSMGSFLYSFLGHVALAAVVFSSTSGGPDATGSVQVQLVETERKAPVVTKIPVKEMKLRPKASVQEVKDIKSEAVTPQTDAPAESYINLQQAGTNSDQVFSYLVTQIYKNRIYPYESIRLNQQGHVTLSFYINDAGELTDISLLQPSDYKPLNTAAVRTLKTLKLNKDVPNIETLYKRRYSFTFDFELVKTL